MNNTLRWQGVLLVALILLAAATPSFAAKTYTMKDGDTLWELAQRFYGDPTLYPVFLEVNQISNPRTIPTGKVITVPNFDDMKKIANEPDPAKRKALITQAQSGSSSSTSSSNSNSSSSNTNSAGSNSAPSGPYPSRSMEKSFEGVVDPQAVKSVSTDKK